MMKLILIIFLVIIFILSIVTLTTNNWLINMPQQVGLWQICNPCGPWPATISSLNALRTFSIIMCIASLLTLVACYMIPPVSGQKNIIRGSLILIIICTIVNLSVTPVLKKKLETNSPKDLKLNYSYSYYLQIFILVLSLIILGVTFYKTKVKISDSPKFKFEASAWV